MVLILSGRVFRDDRRFLDCGDLVAGRVAASVSAFDGWRELGFVFLDIPRANLPGIGRDCDLQHYADAEASLLQSSENWIGRFCRGALADRRGTVLAAGARPRTGHLLVRRE